jgi:hypothetical protein
MIRRGFWLLAGAAGGIMGYRRVSSLGRQVSAKLGARPERREAVKRHWARETIRFTRDVREGMDLYSARHPRDERSSLDRKSRRSLTFRPLLEAAVRQAGGSGPAAGSDRGAAGAVVR